MLFSVYASPRWREESVASTAIALTGTTQFIEARRSDYKYFKTSDLWARAATILQIQFFMLYQWSLERFLIAHPTAEAFLPKKYYMVNISNFTPEDEDIKLYLHNPKFLWRFSIRNYGYFAKIFGRYLPFYSFTNEFADGKFLPYLDDDSPLLPYVKSSGDLVKFTLKNKLKISRSFASHGVKLERIKQIESKFRGKILTPFEKSEYLHSDDFHLHLMGSDFDYDDFVQTLITGHTFRGPGSLLKMDIQQSNQLIRIEKLEKKQLKTDKKIARRESRAHKQDRKLEDLTQKKTDQIECNDCVESHNVTSTSNPSNEFSSPFCQTIVPSMKIVRLVNSNITSAVQTSSSIYSTIDSSIARERLSRRIPLLSGTPNNPYLSAENVSLVHDAFSESMSNDEFSFHTANVSKNQCDNIPNSTLRTESKLEHSDFVSSDQIGHQGEVEIPAAEYVEIVDCFDPPKTALPYLGKAGRVDRKVRLTHLNELARVRKESSLVTNDYLTCSFWNHRALLSDYSKPQSFYKVAYQYFGETVNVNHFVELKGTNKMARVGWRLPCTSLQQSNFVTRYLIAVENYKNDCFSHFPVVKKDSNGGWVTEKSPLYLGEALNEILNIPFNGKIGEEKTTLSSNSLFLALPESRATAQSVIDEAHKGKIENLVSSRPMTPSTSAITGVHVKVNLVGIETDSFYRPPSVNLNSRDFASSSEAFNPWVDSAAKGSRESHRLKITGDGVTTSPNDELENTVCCENQGLSQLTPNSLNGSNRRVSTSQTEQISFHTCDLSLSPCGTEIEKMVDEKTDFLFSSVEARLDKIPIEERTSLTVIQCVEEEMATRPRMREFFYESKANYLKTGSPIDTRFATARRSQYTATSNNSLDVDMGGFTQKSQTIENIDGKMLSPTFSSNPNSGSVSIEIINDTAHSESLSPKSHHSAHVLLKDTDKTVIDANASVSVDEIKANADMIVLKAGSGIYDTSCLRKNCDDFNGAATQVFDTPEIYSRYQGGGSNDKTIFQTFDCSGKTDTFIIEKLNSNVIDSLVDGGYQLKDHNKNSKYADAFQQVQELENIFKLMLQEEADKRAGSAWSENSNCIFLTRKNQPSNFQCISDNQSELPSIERPSSGEGATDILDLIDDYINESSTLNDENTSMRINRLCLKSF